MLLEGHSWVATRLQWINDPVGHRLGIFIGLSNPLIWGAALWTWWTVRTDHRTGRATDLYLTGMGSSRLALIKLAPLTVVLGVAATLGEAPRRWQEASSLVTQLSSIFPSQIGTFKMLMLHSMTELIPWVVAAALFTCSAMLIFSAGRARPSCVIVPCIVTGFFHQVFFSSSFLIFIWLSVRHQYSLSDISPGWLDTLIFLNLLRFPLWLVPIGLSALHLTRRFRELYAEEPG